MAINKSYGRQMKGPLYLSYHQNKPTEEELPDHLHDWHEVIFVFGGSGTFLIDSQLLPAKAGDVFIIPSNKIHRGIPDKPHYILSNVLYLHPRLFAESSDYEASIIHLANQTKQYKFHLTEQAHCTYLLDQLHKEQTEQALGHVQAMMAFVQLIFVHLNRFAIEDRLQPRMSRFGSLLAYIEEHLSEPLSLDELAKRENVTTAHLSRLFKREVGLTVFDYILTKRISLAKSKLMETGDTIEEIAYHSGFSSLPHFYRSFKRLTDMTPHSYRKENRILKK
ncbi:AraC-like DNA-binding protein [Alkalihalobacillus xiaoxiensis]|uniref:AraC-like DNA-binding protein n=1 Tax=Shouchella xiaoxiensis TaxID=766895 RepID=A0ABS2SWX2_9BACI|nr:AraC family transcriptional regulator [Shouchella xiaoxiensis]MBM7839280.1 AraC-like DNA-binding protein [Shouchella xiaoxiensis]